MNKIFIIYFDVVMNVLFRMKIDLLNIYEHYTMRLYIE